MHPRLRLLKRAFSKIGTCILLFCAGYLLLVARNQLRSEKTINGKVKLDDKSLASDEQLRRFDSECGCRRLLSYNGSLKSTCSDVATSRGPGQKVISFSLFGHHSPYIWDVKRNARYVEKYYPDHVMRVYHDAEVFDKYEAHIQLCEVFCFNSNLDLCNVHSLETFGNISRSFGMVWRYAPMADPLVDEWHSRDLDSSISEREASAVSEWRTSNQKYHIMRDHPMQRVPIPGGLFGARVMGTRDREASLMDFRLMIKASINKWLKGLDQVLLEKLFAEKVEVQGAVIHDSYTCNDFRSEFNRPFPTQRLSGPMFSSPGFPNFVGSNGGIITLEEHGGCPRECRPKQHKDWELC